MPTKNLDLRGRRFVDAYLGSAAGNGTEAARQAGYAGNAKVLAVQATRLLKKANVRKAIEARQVRAEEKGILNADERDKILSDIARKGTGDVRDRIRAIGELNKCSGRHSMKHIHDGKLTLEDALTASRKPKVDDAKR